MSNKNGGNQQLLLDLFRAYFDARKNKRSTANALAFESGYEEKLFKLYEDIMNRTYIKDTLGEMIDLLESCTLVPEECDYQELIPLSQEVERINEELKVNCIALY